MYDDDQLSAILSAMAQGIRARELRDPALVGIHSGGVWLAERLHPLLGLREPFGTLDISFYRDDFSRVGLNPEVRASELPWAVADRDLILVDDVLHTGRTIRAAMEEIFSYGRPDRVCLAALIERPGRELPIQADVVGQSLALGAAEEARLERRGARLSLEVVTLGAGS